MVRIFCLSSIIKIPTQPNPVEIYQYEDVIERLWNNEKEKVTSPLLRLKKDEPSYGYSRHIFFKSLFPREYNVKREASDLSNYKLTEIAVGWKNFKGSKMFSMYLFRDDTDIIKIKMVRGAVKFIEVEGYPFKDAFDLLISTSKFFDNYPQEIDFDIRVKVRCIKNTKNKNITQEEEECYKKFAEQLKEISKDLQEIELIRKPLILPNLSQANVLRTKLSDISILIRYLCDPETGSAKNVFPEKGQPTPRYCQQLSIWLKSVNEIVFENIDILDVSLHDLLYETNLSNLYILKLRKCKIPKLSRSFLKMLPETIEELDFSYNNLALITQPISKLLRLKKLDLANNETLTELPWTDLPASIEELDLSNTNVKIIPKEISRLSKLKHLIGNFSFVSWGDLSGTIQSIYIVDTKVPINEMILYDKCKLTELTVINAGIEEIDCTKLPPNLKGLNLSGNNIKYFDCKNALTDLRRLILQAENICLENLPPTIRSLTLSNISIIPSDISKLTRLTVLHVHSKNLKSISWKEINPLMLTLEISGGGNSLNNTNLVNNDINMADKKEMHRLRISNIGLTEINCEELRSKLKWLNLENNKIKTFDCKNSLRKLEWLELKSNGMEEIIWENFSSSLHCIKIDNNELDMIGNISHLSSLGYIYASGNKIANLCLAKDDDWSVFLRFKKLFKIDLGNNNLSHLPIGFEMLDRLNGLYLNNNKFDNNNGHLDEKLWNRLPPNLGHLNLNYNTLLEIPCCLKRLKKLKILEVVDCKLTKICSYILNLILNRTPMPFHELYMDIRCNPMLKCIPYIPRNILKKFTHPTQTEVGNKVYNLIIDNLNIINISTHRIKYDFKEVEDNFSICKCCVKCGEETNEKPIKQLFIMDINMVLKLENGTNKEYPKGKWRSDVTTRICLNCLNSLKDIILSEEFKTLQLKTVAVLPGKRENHLTQNLETFTSMNPLEKRPHNVLSNIPFYQMQFSKLYPGNTQSQETYYTNQNEVVPFINPSMQGNSQLLPSIEQAFSNHRYFDNSQRNNFNPNQSYFNTINDDGNLDIEDTCFYDLLIPTATSDSSNFISEPLTTNEIDEIFYCSTVSSNNMLYTSYDPNFDPSVL